MNENQQPREPQQPPSPVQPELPGSPSPQPPTAPSPSSRPKGRKLLIASVGIAALLVGAVVTWLVLRNNQPSDTAHQSSPDSQNDTKETVNAKSPQDIMDKIYENLSANYTLLDMTKNNHPSTGEASVQKLTTTAYYQVKGYDYSSNYDGGASLNIIVGPVNSATDKPPRDSDVKLRKEIADTYTRFGLTKIDTVDDGTVMNNVYAGKDIVCFVAEPEAASLTVNAACGEISKYEAAAKAAQPFATLLKIDNNANNVVFAPKITDSIVDGYQRAEVSYGRINGGGGVALFYKKADGQWIYFTSTQQLLSCTEYNTTELRNAFKGEPCYDSKGASIEVQ